jgi:phenylacetyl-CoA:acceptor oxidoreductase subunit 1
LRRTARPRVYPYKAAIRHNDESVIIYDSVYIGRGYCAVALPYQARYKTTRPRFVSGDCRAGAGAARFDARRPWVAATCAPCAGGSEAGFAQGSHPGVDAEAPPVCAAACMAGLRVFGDIDDPDAEVTRWFATTRFFRMHVQLGTGPGVHCNLWE